MGKTVTDDELLALLNGGGGKVVVTDPEILRALNKEDEPQGGIDRRDIQGFGTSLLSGQLMGAGNEVIGAARTLIDAATPSQEYDFGDDVVPNKQSIADTYRMYSDDATQSRDEFHKEHPVAGFGTEMVGALASPINKVAPGLGAKGNVSERVAATTARGFAEGGLTGFLEGSGGFQGRLDSAHTGSLLGGGMSLGFSGGLGSVGRALSNRRIDQDLIPPHIIKKAAALRKAGQKAEARKLLEDNFTPAHLADHDGMVGEIYRNTIGRAWGGKQALRKQEQRFIDAAEEALEQSQRELAAGSVEVDDVVTGVKRALAGQREEIAKEGRRSSARLVDNKKKILAETEQALEYDARNLQTHMAQESLPNDYRVQYTTNVDMDDPLAASKQLKAFWDNDAFRMVKENEFTWDEGIVDDLQAKFGSDPFLILTAADHPNMIKAMRRAFGLSDEVVDLLKAGRASDKDLATIQKGMAAPGTIKIPGDALMEMRNFFAKAYDPKNDKTYGYKLIKKRFDQMIKDQLGAVDKSLADGFQNQLDVYPNFLAYRKAVASAKNTGGRFTPNQAKSSAASFGDVTVGDVPFFKEISDVQGRAAQTKKAVKLDAGRVGHTKRRIAQRTIAAKNRAGRNAQLLLDQTDAKGTKARLSNKVKKARHDISDLRESQVPLKTSGLSSILTTGLLGAPAAAVMPMAVLPAGYTVAKGASTMTGQRAAAGQLQIQKMLADALRRGDLNLYSRLLARQAASTGTR